MNQKSSANGYAALITSIILCAALLVVTVAVGCTAFYLRQNLMENEFKAEGRYLSESCLAAALLDLAELADTSTAKTVSVGKGFCRIFSVAGDTPVAGQTTIKTGATVGKTVSNYQAVVDSVSLQIVAWQELP
ncbi:MAG TPA: hypothetical protein VHA30_02325 [Patescibacteria group bacterium]|nr:hypothetical protein [Patescibacteria group bacterium]